MPVYRVNLFSNMSVMGVGETYWTRGNVGAATFTTQLQHLLNLRTDLMYSNQEVVGVRVTNLGTDFPNVVPRRQAVFLPPGKRKLPDGTAIVDIRERGTFGAPSGVDRPDQLRAALQMRIIHGGGRSTTRYLAAVPDQLTTYEPGTLDLTTPAGWWNKFNDFATVLSTTWSILARIPHPIEPEFPVAGLVIQSAAPSYVGVVVPQPPSVPMVQGDRVHLKGFTSIFGRKYSLNGTWTVDSVVGTTSSPFVTIFLRGSNGIDITRFKRLGTIQRVRFRLDNIERVDPIRAGIHKRGRPSPAPRGRRLTGVRLDP